MGHADVELLSEMLVSAKRTGKERRGVHAWHPYYAGYSEAFVEGALRYLCCTADSLILDPWAGSGTTCLVAARNGIASIGIDVNPVMATFAGAKNPEVLQFRKEIIDFFENCLTKTEKRVVVNDADPLCETFSLKTVSHIRLIWRHVFKGSYKEVLTVGSDSILGDAIKAKDAFIAAVLFVTLRQLSGIKNRTNPTWLEGRKEKISIPQSVLQAELCKKANEMLNTLDAFYQNSEISREIYSMVGNAANIPLPDRSIDCIITSPPYLTRIDYAISTAPELNIFGVGDLVTRVRHATTGAPVITKELKEQRDSWGFLCNEILDRIKSHDSKAAATYYWKNITQYFMDIDKAMSEIYRVLRPGGRGLIVVQSSFFKEIEIPLGQIYVEMARNKGFSSRIAFREEVRNHMAHVNTRSNKYVANKIFFEDAVHIEKAF